MADKEAGGDDRSMSEILASIRKIVTDEEANRRSVEVERAQAEPTQDAGVFVLTGEMRATEAPAPSPAPAAEAAAPLTLSAAQQVAAPKPAPMPEETPAAPADAEIEQAEQVDFSGDTGLTEEDIEDIVRRVVREELQGPIGQQISRKVKRLIRDEVAKALAEEESLL